MTTEILISKGKITIPVSIRNELKYDAKDRVRFIQTASGRCELVPLTHRVKELKGMPGSGGKGSTFQQALLDNNAPAGAFEILA